MFSRRAFVKSGGALIVAASFPGRARAGSDPFASSGPFDLGQVDSFLAVLADGTVQVKTGRVEVGQGTTTGLLLVVAEELDVDLDGLEFVRHDTAATPNTGGTLGSSSIALAGPRLRSAAATARQVLLPLPPERHLSLIHITQPTRPIIKADSRKCM
jgi:nicotinate dehydrogenase subunit B